MFSNSNFVRVVYVLELFGLLNFIAVDENE